MTFTLSRHATILAIFLVLTLSTIGVPGELAGHKFLMTLVRTGDTEIFLNRNA